MPLHRPLHPLEGLEAALVVWTWGNHDWIGTQPDLVPTPPANTKLLVDERCAVTVRGETLQFYGTPWQPTFFNWAFQDEDEALEKRWAQIPADTDVLVVHGAPYRMGDGPMAVGSKTLTARIFDVAPPLVVCGHIHNGAGVFHVLGAGDTPVTVVNASVVDEGYRLVRKPIVWELEPRR